MKRVQKELLRELARSRAKVVTAPVLTVRGEAPRIVEKAALVALENAGLVESRAVPGGVVFKITAKGRDRARERTA